MKNKLMTHVVAGYPTETKCIELMFGMQAAGVCAIEVQIPFSDPGADGPTIMEANDIALQNGMTISRCFQMIKSARKRGFSLPVYMMSYANKLYSFGIERFCQEAMNCQVNGFIVPDLPFDEPEYNELSVHCATLGLDVVPVLSPGICDVRLRCYGIEASKLVYLTSTRGITGKELRVDQELVGLIKKIRSMSSCQIALGFGICNLEHVRLALGIADIAVIGSEIIRAVEQGDISSATKFINQLVTDKRSVK